MRKPTYEQQNAWLSKYVAPVFLDLNFGPVIDATIKSLWEKYVSIPREIRENRKPEAREEMRKAGVYDSLQKLDFEGSMDVKFRRILMGDVEENQKEFALLSDVREYKNLRELATDMTDLYFHLLKKPLEVLETRINREIQRYSTEAQKSDWETNFRREGVIKRLLEQYVGRTKPEDRDQLFQAHLKAFQVRDREDYNIWLQCME